MKDAKQEVGGPGVEEPHAVVVREESPTSVPVVGAAFDMVQLAIEKDLDIEKLERLIALRDREREAAAARSFAAAMAEFQKRCPPIDKGKLVDYVTKTGVRIKYRHAELRDIQATIRPICGELGLSYSWTNAIEAGKLTTTCTVLHRDGHSRSASFTCPVENSNPGMSDQQKPAGALTFGERYTIIQAFGLVTAEPDTDGETQADTTPITEQQAGDIEALLADAKVSRVKYLDYLKAESVEKIRAVDFKKAVALLQEKIRAREAKAVAK